MPAQCRISDPVQGVCVHGCPAEPHAVYGNAMSGSPDVYVNTLPAFRLGDKGIHAACCYMNMWSAFMGSMTVYINGRAAIRQGDMSWHCDGPGYGGVGTLQAGSPNVSTGG